MRLSWIAVAAALPMLTGAALHPTLAVPQAQPITLAQSNFIDRLFQDNRPRRKASSNRRSQRSSARAAVPALPAVGPVPLPKPGENTQTTAEPTEQPAPSQATPPEGTTTTPEAAPTAPTPAPTPAPAQPPAKPSDPAPAPENEPPKVEQPGAAAEPSRSVEVPTPQPKPEEPAPTDAPAPASPPAPTPSTQPGAQPQGEAEPSPAPTTPGPDQPTTDEQAKPQEPPPLPVAKEDPEELKACLADLSAIGGKFKEVASIDEGQGCGIDKPLEVAEILPGVEVGGAVMRCKTALSLSRWIKNTAQPALDIAMPGRKITGMTSGSTYACRLRNSASTGKISEHARGNAFDVAAFKLDNGDTIDMKPRAEDSTLEGAFQRTATAGACLHFTTVLSPGSDATHEDHLHLDVMERENGYRYCR